MGQLYTRLAITCYEDYISQLEKDSVEPNSTLTKIDRLTLALKYCL